MARKKSKYLHHIKDLPVIMLTEKSKAHMISSQNMLISIIENPAGCGFPMHSHPAEQIAIILEGEAEHTCGDETFVFKAGDICIHPSNIMHASKTITRVKAIDIFCPPREDYLETLKRALKERGEEE
jgi:quercetin dioxygenase-like cupin family protein